MNRSVIGMALVLMGLALNVEAADKKDRYVIRPSDTMHSILESDIGLPIKVRLRSGAELSGIVTKVGNGVVQLSELAGMEYYDAIVRIDDISAVIVKVRKQ